MDSRTPEKYKRASTKNVGDDHPSQELISPSPDGKEFPLSQCAPRNRGGYTIVQEHSRGFSFDIYLMCQVAIGLDLLQSVSKFILTLVRPVSRRLCLLKLPASTVMDICYLGLITLKRS